MNELKEWQRKMSRQPSLVNRVSRRMQAKLNSYIPEKIHKAITIAIKQMIRGALFGAKYITRQHKQKETLEETEAIIKRVIVRYQRAAATEGGITGAGGLLMGIADFPILLGIKLKMLFHIAGLYGFSVKDYKERLFILHIFQLAFSSQEHKRKVYLQTVDWDQKKELLPKDIHDFEWRDFQQEYRDYLDIAKLAQLIPGIGAVVGIVVNYRLIKHLGITAMNAYRMRLFKTDHQFKSS